MRKINHLKVWNFDLPPYDGTNKLDMSENCQINRLLKYEAGRLACINQLDHINNAQELKKFQYSLRKKIREKAAVSYDRSLPLDVRKYGRIQNDGFAIEKLIYCSRPGIYVTALLYIPDGSGKFPAVLQMHGHSPDGKFNRETTAFAVELAKSGFVCLCVDAIGTYERANECYTAEYHGNMQGGHLLNTGETLLGCQLTDNMRAVDLLASLDFVDKNRIGAAGASGGGNQTLYLSAMDERIAAAVPVVCTGSFQSYVYGVNCLCELLYDGLTFTEVTGVLALIAPRPLKIANALYDENHDFSPQEMLKSYHPVERIYWNLGYPQNIDFYIADRPHGLSDRMHQAALGHFRHFLKGEDNSNAVCLPECDVPDENVLKLFPNPLSRPEEVASIYDICLRKGDELHRKMLNTANFAAKKKSAELRRLLRFRQVPSKLTLKNYKAISGIQRFALTAGDHLIPFLYVPGTVPGKVNIILHPEGKAAVSDDVLEQAAISGASLLLPDIYGTGETAQENNSVGLHHQFFRQLLWIGRSLMGEWVFDAIALIHCAGRFLKANEITLTGIKECGMTAIFARIISNESVSVTTVDSPASLRFNGEKSDFPVSSSAEIRYGLSLSVPGILEWGDISLAQALCGGNVNNISPRRSDGTSLTNPESTCYLNEVELLNSKIV